MFFVRKLWLTFQLLLFLCAGNVSARDVATEIEKILPPIYEADFTNCTTFDDSKYCLAQLELIPPDPKPYYWKEVEARSHSHKHFDRRYLARAICVPQKLADDTSILEYVKNSLEENIAEYNLSFEVNMVNCRRTIEFSSMDICFVILIILHILMIIYATMWDMNRNTKTRKRRVDEWILSYSVISNWEKVTIHKSKNKDFNKLMCIQGIRFYSMTFIILCHIKLAWAQNFVSNPEFIEYAYTHWFVQLNLTFETFLVQPFFLISSWLLTNQILELYRSNGKFTIYDCFILMVNRIFRYLPTLFVMVLMMQSSIGNLASGPFNFDVVDATRQACIKNWWGTLFQISNVLPFSEMCNPGTWYLSVDTQYFLAVLAILFASINYKWNLRKILTFSIIFTLVANAIITGIQNLDVIVRPSPENIKGTNFLHYPYWTSLHTGVLNNWAASLVGIAIGIIYFHTKEKDKTEWYEKVVYPLVFYLFPVVVIYTASIPTKGIGAISIGPLLKPLYATGVGLGILGMSRNSIKGWAKRICEWKYAVIMGNFSFSTYIFHFAVIFARGNYNHVVSETNWQEVSCKFCRGVSLNGWLGCIGASIYGQKKESTFWIRNLNF
ncbi:O-acyltransferase like protein-like isoform X2 [Cylas formicarius]|uniref:O-acyltransferase like protein-like isoform X2 n=1 Tax=Cylas formicarius TaxID=197179 RepID=UPI0029589446|nr:O-acyltransferase like protein-like isoform X2 [Cylas formicarius]